MPLLWSDSNPLSRADREACRSLIRTGSRTFYAASLVLPLSVRVPAYALYAFCRLADDAVDLDEDGSDAVGRLRERLHRAYAGRPFPIPADRAFAETVARHGIPITLPEALIEGFEWDADGRRYHSLSDLYAYAARVAGTVGAMMTTLMGARAPEVVARACDLGVAMQLTNIARDVGEDARAGRIYLPLEWMVEAGIDPEEFLACPRFSPALGMVIGRLLAAADALYARSESGIARLPLGCRPAIYAARYIYAEIGRELERMGHDSVSRRAVVSGRRKTSLMTRALAATPRIMALDPAPALPETSFLVDAVVASPSRILVQVRREPRQRLDDRLGRVLELLADLETRERRDLTYAANQARAIEFRART